MVLLTMTPAIVAAVEKYQELQPETERQQSPSDASISSPCVGKPISHGQLLDISRCLLLHSQAQRDMGIVSYHLDDLLRGSQVYIAPPEPKAEPSSEFKQLMARLRREEEARSYARMLNPAPQSSNPFKSFTAPDNAAAWDLQAGNAEADEMKLAEVNRQLALIINVLVSIIACSIAVWLVTQRWSGPARLALSMLCSIVVGVAEVAIYAGYIRKLDEAKSKEKAKPETKTVTDTWVIESGKRAEPTRIRDASSGGTADLPQGARRRKGR